MLTQALHGVRAEDLAGPLGPEVVTGYVLTVTATEHQPVAVLFLPRFQVLQVRTPCLCTSCTLCPDPRRFCGLCRPERRAALNLTAHVMVPSTPDPNSCGGIQAAQAARRLAISSLHTLLPTPTLGQEAPYSSCSAQNQAHQGKADTTSPTPRTHTHIKVFAQRQKYRITAPDLEGAPLSQSLPSGIHARGIATFLFKISKDKNSTCSSFIIKSVNCKTYLQGNNIIIHLQIISFFKHLLSQALKN